MWIPFIKAHGAGNDFLFTYQRDLPSNLSPSRMPDLAKAICNRNTGVGGDGWYCIEPGGDGVHARLHLYNSDGGTAEISGNGTRCAAAILVEAGEARDRVRITTGAGPRDLLLLRRDPPRLWFEMAMGVPRTPPEGARLALSLSAGLREVILLDVGNPQCVVAVESLRFDWVAVGREIEAHPHFPSRTNVSFLRRIDGHSIEARFYERGAGHTLSSGTGATGAAAAALLLGLVESPVRVATEFCDLEVRRDAEGVLHLTGPAEITARGEFLFQGGQA